MVNKPSSVDVETASVKDIAKFFNKSPSWVYSHYKEIGGKKLVGGSIIFPRTTDIYDRLFHTQQGLEIPLFLERNQILEHRKNGSSLVSNKKRGKKSGGKKKGKDKRPIVHGDDPHALFKVAK